METEIPTVSVVIPCYNAKNTIRGCMGGLLEQDYPSFEIIAVDDNSNDGTGELLRTFAGVQVVLNTANYGPAHCRNKAIEASKGEILLFIDSDCLVDDKRLISKHVEGLHESPVHVLGGGVRGIGRSVVAKADNYSHWFLNIPYSDNRVSTHLTTNNMSVKRCVFDQMGCFDVLLRTGEDTDFCERAVKAGFKLGLKSDAIVQHHDRENLRDFLKCFYTVGLDRIPTRRRSRHRYWYVLPFDFFSSLIYCLPLGLALALQVTVAWFPYDKRVVLFFPLIFLGRLAMTAGIVHYYYRITFEKIAKY